MQKLSFRLVAPALNALESRAFALIAAGKGESMAAPVREGRDGLVAHSFVKRSGEICDTWVSPQSCMVRRNSSCRMSIARLAPASP